ncbi:unnamed protein product, partial [Ectocarpus sp. 12 AP-2014]
AYSSPFLWDAQKKEKNETRREKGVRNGGGKAYRWQLRQALELCDINQTGWLQRLATSCKNVVVRLMASSLVIQGNNVDARKEKHAHARVFPLPTAPTSGHRLGTLFQTVYALKQKAYTTTPSLGACVGPCATHTTRH